MKTNLNYTSWAPAPKMVNTRPRIKKTRNRSGALIGSNDDLLMEIVLRMPVASVLRFKSVSKHWLSLLSQPPFTLRYKNGSISPGFFIHNFYVPFDVENQSAPPFPNLDSFPDPFGIRIVQSCNGLLLCCGNQGVHHDRKYYVYNPTTRQIELIPSIPGWGVRKDIYFMALAFHPKDCVHYKVICFHIVRYNKGLLQIQIYSSETGKWKISNKSFSDPYYAGFGRGVYWNKSIYWTPRCVNPWYFYKLDTEELQSMSLPVAYESDTYLVNPLYFGESRGHLHFVEKADCSDSHLQLNVYEMLNDNSGWFVKYRVELDELLNTYPQIIHKNPDPSIPLYYDFEVLDVVRGEKEAETFMVIRVPGKNIVRYTIADKSFKQIYHLSQFSDGGIGESQVNRYIETIVSL